MKFKNVFWGLSLIIIGSLLVARNIGIIDFAWFNFIRLWPLIFIFWGLSVLPIRETLKVGILVILLGGATWFVLDYPGGDRFNDFAWVIDSHSDNDESISTTDNQDFTVPFVDSIRFAKLDMDAAAGKFTLHDTTSDLLAFSQTGRHNGHYEYIVTRLPQSTTVKITERENHVFHNNNRKQVSIALNPLPVWDINLDAGASDVNYDLTHFKVKSINLDGGAGSFKITIGNKYPDVKINIDAGASSITVKIPENTGCDLEITAVMSGKHLQGFKKMDSGHYQTANYDTAKNKVHLNVDAAVSSFRIERY
jgi:hypothetical protein